MRDNFREALGGVINIISTGVEVLIRNVKQKDENLTFDITAEGYVLTIVTKLKENDIDGFVQTPEGNLPFSAKRELPED